MAAFLARTDTFRRLSESLPVIGSGSDLDDQTRSVLRLIFDREPLSRLQALAEDPWNCPNCGAPCQSERSPYCGPVCREMAALVRRFRAAIADESILEKERQIMIGQALWSFLGGGFPRRQQLVPEKTLAKIIAKAGGKCEVCGAPATEIDHIGTA